MGLPQRRAPAQTTALNAASRMATVIATQMHQATLLTETGEEVMAVASHLGLLLPGQKVLYIAEEGIPGLVIAAYPQSGDAHDIVSSESPLRFDRDTKTLTLTATHLDMEGLASIELRCGTSVFRLNAQGEIQIEGQAITQSAIGPYRIEGASIDLN